jgi:aldehyde dehydrogenase (NAD+)
VNARQNVAWRTEHLVDGCFITGEGEELAVTNPATEEVLAVVRQPSYAQIDAAVLAARRAFESGIWRSPEGRRAALHRIADGLEARADAFRAALISEIGTPVSISGFLQFQGPLDMFRDIAERAPTDRTRRLGVDTRTPASESIIRYEPVGVVAAIGAYNNPLLYLASKAGAALAAGCTTVFCPSALAPLTALLFGEVVREAGVPDGVLNIVAGGREVAKALTTHPEVDKVTMTGSVEVGREVMRQAADTVKGVVLELGGKSAGIVLPGADLSKIALPLHGRYLRNAGQGCQSPTRLLVPQSMFDDFIDASRDAYRQIPVGDPLDKATMAGPLITDVHRARVEGFVERALGVGGEILAGGGRPGLEKGWFMNGALLGGLDNDAEIARTELFGPVAMVIPYHDVDHGIAIANDSRFGLAASVFGPTELARRVATHLRAGTVQINGGGAFRVDSVLAGWKQSGIGREWGEDGILEFLETQHIQWVREA